VERFFHTFQISDEAMRYLGRETPYEMIPVFKDNLAVFQGA
jgi:hypothetical protein